MNSSRLSLDSIHQPVGSTSAVIRLGLLALGTVILVILITSHTPGLNGPTYWQWPWRSLSTPRVALGFTLALGPFVLAHYLYAVRQWSAWAALGLVMLSLFTLEVVAIGLSITPFSLGGITLRIADIVRSQFATSYFTDAVRLHTDPQLSVSQWLAEYPRLSGGFHLHSQTKPPGPILYYLAFVHLYPRHGTAATVGGLVLGLLATLGVPATFWLIQTLTKRPERGFHGASFLALCPSLVLFFPEFDQVYPVLACGIVGLWARCLQNRCAWPALACGAMLAGACFFSYNFLTLGAFMTGFALQWWRCAAGARTRTLVGQAALVLAACVTLYGLFWLAMGFDPIAALRSALRNQQLLLDKLRRPYPTTILFDLTDFALGAGWVGMALALFGFTHVQERRERTLHLLCFGQLATVAMTGLLQAETARVWAFMLPLLMVPLDAELSYWSGRTRLGAYACGAVLLGVTCQNMVFISP